jgi:hypothetical protein
VRKLEKIIAEFYQGKKLEYIMRGRDARLSGLERFISGAPGGLGGVAMIILLIITCVFALILFC